MATHLLREFLEHDLPNSVFGFMFDPEVAELAHKAGVGAKIDVTLGGKIELPEVQGAPLELKDAQVCSLSDGEAVSTTPLMLGLPATFGKTACLRVGNVDIIGGFRRFADGK